MANINDAAELGLFVPTTQIWNLEGLNIDPKLQPLFLQLYQNINNIATALNLKETGYYAQEEMVIGKQYYPDPALGSNTSQYPQYRQVFRKVIDFGALPNSGTKQVAHGIDVNNRLKFTHIYGVANDTSGHKYIPLPYAHPTERVILNVEGNNAQVNTATDMTRYDTTYVVLEYIKQ